MVLGGLRDAAAVHGNGRGLSTPLRAGRILGRDSRPIEMRAQEPVGRVIVPGLLDAVVIGAAFDLPERAKLLANTQEVATNLIALFGGVAILVVGERGRRKVRCVGLHLA